jgi:hypothetical protein
MCECARRKIEYYVARAELSYATRNFVTRVIIGLEQCPENCLGILRTELQQLAKYFGLTANLGDCGTVR